MDHVPEKSRNSQIPYRRSNPTHITTSARDTSCSFEARVWEPNIAWCLAQLHDQAPRALPCTLPCEGKDRHIFRHAPRSLTPSASLPQSLARVRPKAAWTATDRSNPANQPLVQPTARRRSAAGCAPVAPIARSAASPAVHLGNQLMRPTPRPPPHAGTRMCGRCTTAFLAARPRGGRPLHARL